MLGNAALYHFTTVPSSLAIFSLLAGSRSDLNTA